MKRHIRAKIAQVKVSPADVPASTGKMVNCRSEITGVGCSDMQRDKMVQTSLFESFQSRGVCEHVCS